MVLSNDRRLLDHARALRDCEQPGAEQDAFNFKMSDLHAAVARVQLARLEEMLSRRRDLARGYRRALQEADLDLPIEPADRQHAWFRFVVGLRQIDVGALIARCERRGLACRRPVGRLVRDVDLATLPGCRSAWARACSLPLYPALSDDEARAVADRFIAALGDFDE